MRHLPQFLSYRPCCGFDPSFDPGFDPSSCSASAMGGDVNIYRGNLTRLCRRLCDLAILCRIFVIFAIIVAFFSVVSASIPNSASASGRSSSPSSPPSSFAYNYGEGKDLAGRDISNINNINRINSINSSPINNLRIGASLPAIEFIIKGIIFDNAEEIFAVFKNETEMRNAGSTKSKAKATDADVIFLIDGNFDANLNKYKFFKGDIQKFILSDYPQIEFSNYNAGTNRNFSGSSSGGFSGGFSLAVNPYIFLNPAKTEEIIKIIAMELAKIAPEAKSQLYANAASLINFNKQEFIQFKTRLENLIKGNNNGNGNEVAIFYHHPAVAYLQEYLDFEATKIESKWDILANNGKLNNGNTGDNRHNIAGKDVCFIDVKTGNQKDFLGTSKQDFRGRLVQIDIHSMAFKMLEESKTARYSAESGMSRGYRTSRASSLLGADISKLPPQMQYRTYLSQIFAEILQCYK